MTRIEIKKHKENKYYFSIYVNGFLVEEYYDYESLSSCKSDALKLVENLIYSIKNIRIIGE